jgi:CRISPR-associated protein Cmr5
MAQTLEQKRAVDAWKRVQGCSGEYQKLCKSLPALIMNSGLLQVLAFLNEKGTKDSQVHCKDLGDQLRDWLSQRFPQELPRAEFAAFMHDLMKAEPRTFQAVTAESMAWLRWVRQMAPALRSEQR